MDVVFDLAAAPRADRGAAVTIGAYDGVHLGHQAVLRELRRLATDRGLETVVVTFDRHPATVVRPESAPKLLTDLDQKLDALAATGNVDRTVVVRFDRARSQEEPEQFVREVLVDGLDARLVVVGEDFHFGRARRGNVALLRGLGWFEVVGLGLVQTSGVGPVSSTSIRSFVAAGDVQSAARLLGRPFEVRGVVISGDRRGRAVLGYPTANIEVAPELLVPALGIYAGWYERPGGTVLPAAISMGRRPTFHAAADAPPVLEAYLLDFDGDLYDEPALVRFVSHLRDERRFDSAASLKVQMARDVEQTRVVLGVTHVP